MLKMIALSALLVSFSVAAHAADTQRILHCQNAGLSYEVQIFDAETNGVDQLRDVLGNVAIVSPLNTEKYAAATVLAHGQFDDAIFANGTATFNDTKNVRAYTCSVIQVRELSPAK